MMEFFTTYQMPLIFGGLLIIMGLIGYEADQKMKREGNPLKKEKKKKKVSTEVEEMPSDNEIPVIEEMTVESEPQAIVETESTDEMVETVEDTNYQYETPAENVDYSAVEDAEQQVDQLVAYNYQENVENIEHIQNYEVQNTKTDESLQAFVEPTSNVQNSDTFGANDMSSFQVQQNVNQDASAGNIDAWKL